MNDNYEQGQPVRFFNDGNRDHVLITQIIGILKNNRFRVAYVDRPVELHEIEMIGGIGDGNKIVVKIPTNAVRKEDMEKVVKYHNGEIVHANKGEYVVRVTNPLDLFWMGMNFEKMVNEHAE